MSYTKKKSYLTYILIAMIPIAGIAGWLITSSIVKNPSSYQLDIAGSTTVFKIINEAQRNFTATHPGVSVVVSGTGTGAGISALIAGSVDLAMASRPVKAIENETANGQLKVFTISKDGLAIIIHGSANPLDISIDTARAIFNGTVTDWSHSSVVVAGLTGTIQIVVREEGSGTRDAFNELVMGDEKQLQSGSAYPGNEIAKSSNQFIVDAIAANTNYIGYIGLGYVDERVDAVIINGITPSVEAVQNGTYEIQRDLYLVTVGFPIGLVSEFINWMLSPEGQSIVVKTGFINIALTKEDIYK